MTARAENDFYPTPPELSLAICQTLNQFVPPPDRVVESSAGTGSFIRAARAIWPRAYIVGVDVDPSMQSAMDEAGANRVIIGDWEQIIAAEKDLKALLVGNDPFSMQVQHVLAGLKAQADGEWHCKLGRMSLLGSRERVEFWRENPCRFQFPLIPRPNFQKGMVDPVTLKKKGGDNSEYMLYCWQKGFKGVTRQPGPIVWR